MKKIIVALILLLFSFQAAYGDMPPEIPVQTDDVYTLNVSLPVSEYVVGDQVYVNIGIDADEVKGFEIVFDYDTDYLEYKSVSVNSGDTSDEDNIVIEQINNNEVLYACTTKKEKKINSSTKLCTINFIVLRNGDTSVTLKSAKIVFDNMKYFLCDDINDNTVSVKLGKEEIKKPIGSGGGGGGGFYVKPEPEKEIVEETIIEENTDKTEGIVENNIFFTDVAENFWGYKEICFLAEKGVIKGYEDGSFKPEQSITRAEFAKMLVMTIDTAIDADYIKTFDDVKETDWFAEFAMTAAKLKIFLGDENNCFNPNKNISREDAATALSRYIIENKLRLEKVREKADFMDFKEISDYAEEHIYNLFELGIVNGYDNNFYPQTDITRAEASAMIYRAVIR